MDNWSTATDNKTGIRTPTVNELLIHNMALERSLALANKRAADAWAVIHQDFWRNHYDELAAFATALAEPVKLVQRTVHAEGRLDAAVAAWLQNPTTELSVDHIIAALRDTAMPAIDPATALELLADPIALFERDIVAEALIDEIYAAGAGAGADGGIKDDAAGYIGIQLRKYSRYELVAADHRI